MKLTPINNCLLVEWEKSPYEGIPVPEGKYASRTEGIVVRIADTDDSLLDSNGDTVLNVHNLIGKKVYWEEYKDTVRTEHEGKTYAFIKFEDIRGFCETD